MLAGASRTNCRLVEETDGGLLNLAYAVMPETLKTSSIWSCLNCTARAFNWIIRVRHAAARSSSVL